MGVVPVGCSDPILDQAAPGDEQLLHVAERLAHHRPDLQCIQRAETGEHGGIDGVGLGALPYCLCEVPGLQRIDLDHGHTGIAEPAFKSVVIGTCRLEDDAVDRPLAEPCQQVRDAGHGVGKVPGYGLGVEINVEGRFGDVDANSLRHGRRHLFHVWHWLSQ